MKKILIYKNAPIIENDGITHINIWNNAKTDLGKLLAYGKRLPFNDRLLGYFASIDSAFRYIQLVEKDEIVRELSGRELREYSKKLETMKVSNFKAIIAYINYRRILESDILYNNIVSSTLPFDVYYTVYTIPGDRSSGIKCTRPKYSEWITKSYKEIRSALIEDRDPDFTNLKDDKYGDLYCDLKDVIETVSVKNKLKEYLSSTVNSGS